MYDSTSKYRSEQNVVLNDRHNDEYEYDYRLEFEMPKGVSKDLAETCIMDFLSDFRTYSKFDVASVEYYKPLCKAVYVIIYGNTMGKMLEFAENLFCWGEKRATEMGRPLQNSWFVLVKDQRNDTPVEEGYLENGRWMWHVYDGIYE